MSKFSLSIFVAGILSAGAAVAAIPSTEPSRRPSSLEREDVTPQSERIALRRHSAKARKLSGNAPAAQTAVEADICGQLVYMAGGTGSELGFYQLPKRSGDSFNKLGYTRYKLEYGGFYEPEEGIYYGIYAASPASTLTSVIAYNADTWELISQRDLSGESGLTMRATALARDPQSGDVYGFFYNASGDAAEWAKADFKSLTRTKIADFSLADAFTALVATAEGRFYGLDLNGTLMAIDKSTGTVTEIASTDLPIEYQFGACYDDLTASIYATCNTEDFGSGLYSINIADGATELIADFSGDIQIMNLYIRPGASSPKAPAIPTLDVEAPKGSMTVSYSITMPSTLDDGSPASGSMDWSITSGGATVASGTAQAGASAKGSFAATTTGRTDFFATASTAAGRSRRARTTIFIGSDTPADPDAPTLTYADGLMKLSWEAVTASANGGYVDPTAITYNIYAGETLKASDITTTQWSEAVDMPENRTRYQYAVEAVYDGHNSRRIASNVVALGSYAAPFTTLFDSSTTFSDYGYTVVDVNADRKTWTSTALGARYQFNRDKAADDWLFTPAIRLEEGKAYNLTVKVTANSTDSPETFEIKAGAQPAPAAMNIDIKGPTVTNKNPREDPDIVSTYFVADRTGQYHIGIHAISPANMWYLFVKELSVSSPVEESTPDAVTALSVVPDPTGALSTHIAFTMPATTVVGSPLTGRLKVDITRNGTIVNTSEANAGQTVELTDEVATAGEYEYGITVTSGSLAGETVTRKVYVGPYPASAPAEVTLEETETPGRVTLSWTAVTTDINGNDQTDNITYMVYAPDISGAMKPMLSESIKDNSLTFDALDDPTCQSFVYYAVKALNRGYESEPAVSEMKAVGTPYPLPVVYTSARSSESYCLGTDKSGGASWGYMGDSEEVSSADGDGQFYACSSYFANKWGDLISAKISLSASSHPELLLSTYRHDTSDRNRVEVYIAAVGSDFELAAAFDHADMPAKEWTEIHIPLSAYKGDCIQFMIRSVHISHANTLVDHIEVRESLPVDIAAGHLSAPRSAAAGESFALSIPITNNGYQPANDITVTLIRGEEAEAAQSIALLSPGASESVTFETKMSLFDGEEAIFSVRAECKADASTANNHSNTAIVVRSKSDFPIVDGLRLDQTEGTLTLRWNEYQKPADEEFIQVEESFESGEPFAHEFGDWTFVDADGAEVGGIDGVTIPGITPGQTKASFFIFDISGSNVPDYLRPHSGNKMLTALFTGAEAGSDDWAISPALSGKAQTVTFHARSISRQYPEIIKICYTKAEEMSVAELETQFAASTEPIRVPDSWTAYTFDLPEGATHFAIHSIGDDNFMLMIDDVSYSVKPGDVRPEHLGYNVYCDGKCLNPDKPLKVAIWIVNPSDGNVYHLTNLHSKGESELSDPISIEGSGIESVESDAPFTVTAGAGCIMLCNPACLTLRIVTTGGLIVATSDMTDETIYLPTGFYVVTDCLHTSVKIAVNNYVDNCR